jgi:hypothetical protein
MESARLKKLLAHYNSYVDEFNDDSGALPDMMALKKEHTFFVVANAAAISSGEDFSFELRELSIAASLLHDAGRYEQLKVYNTFRDSESIDHALLSHDVSKNGGWLKMSGFDEKEEKIILDAVLFHNRREIPENLDEKTAIVSHTVRDADKLDIFRVLEAILSQEGWMNDTRAFWGLKIDAPPSKEVIDAIRASKAVDYKYVKTLADFILVQVGWLLNGLYFPTSYSIAEKRGHLAFRKKILSTLPGWDSTLFDKK